MGYFDRHGGSSGEGNKQDSSKKYKMGNRTGKKGDKMTANLGKLSSG